MTNNNISTEISSRLVVDEHLMNISELAAYLNMKASTLYSYVEQKQIPHIRIGKLIRFKRQQIAIWLEEFTVQPDGHSRSKEGYRGFNKSSKDVDEIVERAIAGSCKVRYTAKRGKQPASAKEA